MCAPLVRSDYYEASAPPDGRQPATSLPIDCPGWAAGRATADGSHVHTTSIDQVDGRLYPDSIATPTPQTFSVASWPTASLGFRVDPRAAEVVHEHVGHALHPGPYPPDLSRSIRLRGFYHRFTSVPPSDLTCRTRLVWQFRYRPGVVGAASRPSRRSPGQSGRTGGLLRRSPLRTARAAFTASSSSKPRGRRRVEALAPAVASSELVQAGGVHEAGVVTVRWAGSPVVDEVVHRYRLPGDQ
jgi:hypothetical protein